MSQEIAQELDSVRTLRTSHGLSLEALAKHCALSIRQLRQIEEGGHDAFYSPAIKQLAVRKVLNALQDVDSVVRSQSQVEPTSPSRWGPRVLQFNAGAFKATRTARSV